MRIVIAFKIGLIFLFAFSIISTKAIANPDLEPSESKPSSLSINIGPSFPVGDFKKSTGQLDGSGYAKTGFCTNITYDQKLYKCFGIIALLGGQVNSYSKDYQDKQSINATNWYSSEFLIGPRYCFELGEYSVIVPHILFGLSNQSSPQITTIQTNGLSEIYSKNENAFGFGYLAGITLKCNVYKHLLLLLNADYYATKATFSVNSDLSQLRYGQLGVYYGKTDLVTTNVSNSFIVNQKIVQNISTFNTTIGIGFAF